jgi:hypothetical protein
MPLRLLAALALVAVAVAPAGGASAGTTTAKPCTGKATGALWIYQGQTGVAYKVVGVGGASCALGSSWLARFTKQKAQVFKGPPGWSCVAKKPSGACTIAGGGLFHWEPRLRAR